MQVEGFTGRKTRERATPPLLVGRQLAAVRRMHIHPGIFKMNELIGRQYWWPTMLSDVKKYVKGCDACQ